MNYETELVDYFKEHEMPKSIRTDISVHNLKCLKIFLEANNLDSIRLGYWGDSDGFFLINKICYVFLGKPGDTEEANLIYIALKYGSLAAAFTNYIEEINRIGAM